MDVTYELTEEDVAAISEYAVRNTDFGRRMVKGMVVRGVLQGIAFIGLLGIAACLLLDEGGVVIAILCCVALALGAIQLPRKGRRAIVRNSLMTAREVNGPSLFLPTSVSIAEDGVRVRTEILETHMAWSAFERIVGTDDRILLMMGAMRALVIPKRAFVNPGDAEAFLGHVLTWHQEGGRAVGGAQWRARPD